MEQPVKAGMLVTVASMLELPALRRGVPEVVAGRAGLDRPVRWVHAGEVPNMASLLRGGEVLLTTGIAVERSTAAERRFVRGLAERGVAALAIELGRRFATVPAWMQEEAELHGLPLIALHSEVPFVDITEAVHREIVNRQVEVMRRGEALHRRFTTLMLQGAQIPDVLEALAQAVGNPVVLERSGHGVLYHAPGAAGDAATLSAWHTIARRGEGAVAIAAQPVPVGDERDWGKLVALALDSPLDEHDRAAVERAVGLIALGLLRDREQERLAGRERGNFLWSLVDGTAGDETAARTRAATMGFKPRGRVFALAAAPRGHVDERAWGRAWAEVENALAAWRIDLLVGMRAQAYEALALVELPRGASRAGTMGRIAALASAAATRHLGDRHAIVLCVAGEREGWMALGEHLAEAAAAIPAAKQAGPRAWHDADAPDLNRLLFALRASEELRRFTRATLRPLEEHDSRRATKLLETLAAYCSSGGRKTEAARALGIERQSLYHRLARIEALLEVELSDGDALVGLHLALRARRVLG